MTRSPKAVTTNVTLGADPELGFLDNVGFIKEARRVFSFAPGENASTARFGCDGTDAIAEMRPAPTRSPHELVRFLRQDMVDAIKRHPNLSNVNWKAGTLVDHYTLGGHIHFGAWEYMPEVAPRVGNGDITGRLNPIVENAFNLLLAVPGALLERPKEAAQRRTQTGYGGSQPYGTLATRVFSHQPHGFEYRPLASWLTSPYVALGLLCLGKAIMDDLLSNNITEMQAAKLMGESGLTKEGFAHYDEAMLRKAYFGYARPAIMELGRYPEYKKEIDFIHELITKRLSWYPTVPMAEAWGLLISKKPTPEPAKENLLSTRDIWNPEVTRMLMNV